MIVDHSPDLEKFIVAKWHQPVVNYDTNADKEAKK